MDALISFLAQVREQFERNAYPNETAVRSQIVQPVLEKLGWPVYDAHMVHHEYPLKAKGSTRHVDLALCMPNGGSPRCIIELKGPDKVEGTQQLFEYAFHAGAPLALLTNGEYWSFYYIPTGGTYDERLIRTIDLRTIAPTDAVRALNRYLSRENTVSGRAAEYAKEDLDTRINRNRAKRKIPEAWNNLTKDDPDDRLVSLLINETALISDYAPVESDVVSFLRSLRPDGPDHPDDLPPGNPSPSTSKATGRSHTIHDRQKKPQTTGPIHYQLMGSAYEAKNAKDAFVDIITTLAMRDDDFLNRLAPKLRGRKLHGLSLRKSDVTPELTETKRAVQIIGGWWLHINLSNSAKMRVLEKACSVADIPFDNPNGLKIALPNA